MLDYYLPSSARSLPVQGRRQQIGERNGRCRAAARVLGGVHKDYNNKYEAV